MKLFQFSIATASLARLFSRICADSAPAPAVFTQFEREYVIGRGPCTTANVPPAFDLRAEPRTSSE
jgi:hypothetical protein